MSTITHDHEADAISADVDAAIRQAEIASKLSTFYRPAMGRVLMHVEKRGPAFDAPLAVDLARSLQAQGIAACGDVLNALTRDVTADLMPAWDRLLDVLALSITPVVMALDPLKAFHRENTLGAVIAAMANTPSLTHWQNADAAVRSYVDYQAGLLRNRAKHVYKEAFENEQEHTADVRDRVTSLHNTADQFSAWARGGVR